LISDINLWLLLVAAHSTGTDFLAAFGHGLLATFATDRLDTTTPATID
jgi:hypothetical protein